MGAKLPDLDFKKQNVFRQAPGNYEPNARSTMHKSPEYKLGTGQRMGIVNHSENKHKPGPGTYSSVYDPLVTKAPKYGFGTGNRKSLSSLAVPGPGSYSAKEFVGRDT